MGASSLTLDLTDNQAATATGDHNTKIYAKNDARTVVINSRNYAKTSGSTIGMQCKPRQTAATTGDVIGAEFSPRTAGIGAGALICVRADPVLQTASAT